MKQTDKTECLSHGIDCAIIRTKVLARSFFCVTHLTTLSHPSPRYNTIILQNIVKRGPVYHHATQSQSLVVPGVAGVQILHTGIVSVPCNERIC